MRKGKIRINVEDIIGKRLGKLEVISYYGHAYTQTRGGNKMRHYYLCKCDCGNTHKVERGPLKNNKIHSCGCGRRGRYGNKNEE